MALYPDDVLLFLGDENVSLGSAMKVIEDFGINWGKSALMYKKGMGVINRGDIPMHIREVHSFRYLGVFVHLEVTRYFEENLEPLPNRFKVNVTVCSKLLSITGRCKLVKMVWLPQVLYILQNSQYGFLGDGLIDKMPLSINWFVNKKT